MFGVKLNKYYYSGFHPLEVVGRGGKTHFQVGEALNYIT